MAIKTEYDNAQVRFEGAKGFFLPVTPFIPGRDDNEGVFSPDYGIVVKNL